MGLKLLSALELMPLIITFDSDAVDPVIRLFEAGLAISLLPALPKPTTTTSSSFSSLAAIATFTVSVPFSVMVAVL
ncbi:hypothetical protein D3C86_1801930 [compost metagenome]